MSISSFTSHFKFSKQQRNGIFFLLVLIVLLQCIYFFADFSTPSNNPVHPKTWAGFQHAIDSLKKEELTARAPRLYPFNPNYITDYKGYVLGMSTQEIDRLVAYRSSGKFVNSAAEFQQVTQVSDSLLREIAPYFKFPAWAASQKKPDSPKDNATTTSSPVAAVSKQDLNTVTEADLQSIKGIGETLSQRIVKFRKRLGGFLVDEQLYDVYGLPADAANNVLKEYTVLKPPDIRKINLRTATAKELASVAYIPYKLAVSITAYRDSLGTIGSVEELANVKGFPVDKLNRIELYVMVE